MSENFKKIKKLPVLIISIFVFICATISINLNMESIPVSSIQNVKVIPSGSLAGIRMSMEGVLVVGYSDVVGQDGNIYKPAEKTNIKPGDRIIKINNVVINDSKDLLNTVITSKNDTLTITYVRDGKTLEENITPILSKEDGMHHIGLWIKEGAVGIGTISFYGTENNRYASLGHGITDVDTGNLIEANNGTITKAQIVSIEKGSKSNPGQIKGEFVQDTVYGNVKLNSETGAYGEYITVNALDKYKEGVFVASPNEIKEGKATMLSTVDNEIREYEVEIKKVYKLGSKDNKNMVVKITDENLIEKTGGIVQGMSGSPIIQNNKLIGVLTHVFVNDSTQGYAIFAQTMVETMNSME